MGKKKADKKELDSISEAFDNVVEGVEQEALAKDEVIVEVEKESKPEIKAEKNSNILRKFHKFL